MKIKRPAHKIMSKVLVTSLVTLSISLPTLASASGLSRAEVVAENMQPSIPHIDQNKIANEKLAEKLKSTGKKPNILWFVVDDLGFGDI